MLKTFPIKQKQYDQLKHLAGQSQTAQQLLLTAINAVAAGIDDMPENGDFRGVDIQDGVYVMNVVVADPPKLEAVK